MSYNPDRRQFLGRVARAGVAALWLDRGALLRTTQLPVAATGPRGAPKRVVVVGAGLAGLSAAYELTRLGHDVTVLEARSRAGGRVETLREPFADGLYAEAGGTRIPDVHDWTLKYVEHFRLALTPFRPAGLPDVYHLRGRRLVARDGGEPDWPYQLTAAERRLRLSGMTREYLAATFPELGDPTTPGWPPESLAHYDLLTTAGLLRKRGASAEAVALLTDLGLGLPDPEGVSALGTMRNRAQLSRAQRWHRIAGGNDQLPRAFAAQLSAHVRYGAVVRELEQSDRGVRVTFEQGGTAEPVAADRVVCAVPLPLLGRIGVRPALSAEKQRAVREVPQAAVTKVFVQTRRRVWLEQGLSGFATTDLPIMEVWDLSAGQAGERGLLVAYVTGRRAGELGALPEEKRLAIAVEHLDGVFPGLRAIAEGGACKVWHEDEWAGGAYAAFAPGQFNSLVRYLARPEGRIHFAGDHTSSATGWMQGALESGNRAAREVHEATS